MAETQAQIRARKGRADVARAEIRRRAEQARRRVIEEERRLREQQFSQFQGEIARQRIISEAIAKAAQGKSVTSLLDKLSDEDRRFVINRIDQIGFEIGRQEQRIISDIEESIQQTLTPEAREEILEDLRKSSKFPQREFQTPELRALEAGVTQQEERLRMSVPGLRGLPISARAPPLKEQIFSGRATFGETFTRQSLEKDIRELTPAEISARQTFFVPPKPSRDIGRNVLGGATATDITKVPEITAEGGRKAGRFVGGFLDTRFPQTARTVPTRTTETVFFQKGTGFFQDGAVTTPERPFIGSAKPLQATEPERAEAFPPSFTGELGTFGSVAGGTTPFLVPGLGEGLLLGFTGQSAGTALTTTDPEERKRAIATGAISAGFLAFPFLRGAVRVRRTPIPAKQPFRILSKAETKVSQGKVLFPDIKVRVPKTFVREDRLIFQFLRPLEKFPIVNLKIPKPKRVQVTPTIDLLFTPRTKFPIDKFGEESIFIKGQFRRERILPKKTKFTQFRKSTTFPVVRQVVKPLQIKNLPEGVTAGVSRTIVSPSRPIIRIGKRTITIGGGRVPVKLTLREGSFDVTLRGSKVDKAVFAKRVPFVIERRLGISPNQIKVIRKGDKIRVDITGREVSVNELRNLVEVIAEGRRGPTPFVGQRFAQVSFTRRGKRETGAIQIFKPVEVPEGTRIIPGRKPKKTQEKPFSFLETVQEEPIIISKEAVEEAVLKQAKTPRVKIETTKADVIQPRLGGVFAEESVFAGTGQFELTSGGLLPNIQDRLSINERIDISSRGAQRLTQQIQQPQLIVQPQLLDPRTRTAIKERTKLIQKIQQAQVQLIQQQQTTQQQRTGIGITTTPTPLSPPIVPRTRVPPPPPILGGAGEGTLRGVRISKKAYDVYIKRRGVWRKTADDLPLGRALKKMTRDLKASAASHGRVQLDPKARTRKEDINFRPDPAIFRNFQVKKGRQVPLPRGPKKFEYIERKRKRLTTGFETRELISARGGRNILGI